MSNRRLHYLLFAALFVRLLLPAAVFATRGNTNGFITADSNEYLGLAASLSESQRYFRATGPELYRPPGYPLFLALGLQLGNTIPVAILLQAMLGCLTVWLTILIARRLFGDRIAFICGVLAAFEPCLILWSGKIMAETLLTTFVTIAAFALVAYAESDRTRWLVAAGVAVAAAAYVKPVAYFLFAWIAITLLGMRRAAHAAVVLAVAGLSLAPWHARNLVVGDYAGFSTQMDGTIALSAPAAVTAEREGRAFSAVRAQQDQYRRSGPVTDGTYAAARKRGMATIMSAPGTYAWIHMRGMLRTLLHPGAIGYLDTFGWRHAATAAGANIVNHGSIATLLAIPRTYPLVFWSTLVMALVLVPYLVLPAFGLWRFRGRWSPAQLLLASVALYFVLVSGGPWGQSRFRHPIMPILSVLAGYGVAAKEVQS